jgi:hypothetical protein
MDLSLMNHQTLAYILRTGWSSAYNFRAMGILNPRSLCMRPALSARNKLDYPKSFRSKCSRAKVHRQGLLATRRVADFDGFFQAKSLG